MSECGVEYKILDSLRRRYHRRALKDLAGYIKEKYKIKDVNGK